MSRSFHWEPVAPAKETGLLYSVACHLAYALNYSDAGDLDEVTVWPYHAPVIRAISYSIGDPETRADVDALLAALDDGPVLIVVTP